MKRTFSWLTLTLTVLVAIANANSSAPPEEKRMKPALLVIDIQSEYLKMVPEQEKGMALYMINAAINLFRMKGYPIIRVYHTDPQFGPKPGSEEFEFPVSVLIKPDDPKIIKNYANGFKKTELDKLLHEQGCNTLFLCGLSAVGCVLATYQGAMDLDYDAFLIKNALMSHNSEYTKAIEDIFAALSYNALQVMLANAQK